MPAPNSSRELVHGIVALILALLMLGVGSGLGVMKSIVDLWGAILSLPEFPAVKLREVYVSWRERNTDIVRMNDELFRLRSENARLRMELSALNAAPPDLREPRTARVTLRAPMSWWSEVRIDRGSRDGVTPGMAVFSGGYLVGRVSTVSELSAWVELITSPSFMIPAVIDETRELGVAAGDGAGGVLLRYVPAGRSVRAGMAVSTAMVGEQLPPGLPLGEVRGEGHVEADGYVTYVLEAGARLGELYGVEW